MRIASIEMDEEEEMREINGPAAAVADPVAAPGVAAAAVISPYRMNPGYRRPPPPGTDSDHGYSTMTPLGTTHGGGPGTDLESELGVGSAAGVTPYVRSAPARERYARKQQQGGCSLQSVTTTSGVSATNSRSSTPKFKSENVVSSQEEEEEEDEQQQHPPEVTVLSGNQIVVAATVHCSSE